MDEGSDDEDARKKKFKKKKDEEEKERNASCEQEYLDLSYLTWKKVLLYNKVI